jgi:hypothetical protein
VSRKCEGWCLRKAFTIGAPRVKLGTKWPSITSIWSQSAPQRSITFSASFASIAKSADRIEGQIITPQLEEEEEDDILLL